MKTSRWIKALAVLGASMTFFACFEPEEGCLDVNSNNFAFGADRACGDCCTYPQLRLDFSHRINEFVGDSTFQREFNYNTPYRLQSDTSHYFSVKVLRFLFSEAVLLDQTGTPVPTQDTLQVTNLRGDTMVDNRFVLVADDRLGVKTLPEFIGAATVERIRLTIGMGSPLRSIDPNSVARSGHPLRVQDSDSLNYNLGSGYLGTAGVIFPDTTNRATDSLLVELFAPTTFDLPLDTVLTIPPGFSPQVRFEVNYSRLFEGIDFKIDNLPTIEQKIATNLSNSFRVIEASVQDD